VLVDGKRRHVTSTLGVGGTSAAQSVDIALIPTSLVSRIEVLRDGASAVYGSDAIAGVVNVITRKDKSGTNAYARFGTFGSGQGDTYSASLSHGMEVEGNGHLFLTAEYEQRNRTFRGAPLPDDILLYFPLNAAGQQILPQGPLTSPRLPAGATRDPREATRPRAPQQSAGESPYKSMLFAADLAMDLNNNIRLYQTNTLSFRSAQLLNSFRLPLRNEVVRSIFPNGYSPVRDQDETDFEVLTGLQGTAGPWSWDLSTTVGSNRAKIKAHDTLNPSYGADSPTRFYVGTTKYNAWTTNLGVKRSFDLPISVRPVDFAAGLEYRQERYVVTPGEPASYSCGTARVADGPNRGLSLATPNYCGAQAVFGYSPDQSVNATRNNKSAYAELSFYPASPLLISAAGRYEDYSDFGSAWIGRLSSRLEFSPHVALRATVGNAFQAPSLAAIAYRQQVNFQTYIVYSVPVDSREALALGSRPLDPEKSTNFSAGLVAKLGSRVNLSIDAYQIKVRDRVSQSTTIRDAIYPGSGALLASVGIDRNQAINFFINAASTRTQGIEVVLDGSFGLNAWGNLRWTLSGNYNRTKVTSLAESSPILQAFRVPVFSLTDQRNLEERTPRSKIVGDVVWAVGKFELNARGTYYGSTIRYGQPLTVATTGPFAGQTDIGYQIGKLFSADANITYSIDDRFSITASANNIFAARPALKPAPLVNVLSTYEYDESGPISSDGAFFAIGIRAKL
jgi:iron complex outermembrane receptor protein